MPANLHTEYILDCNIGKSDTNVIWKNLNGAFVTFPELLKNNLGKSGGIGKDLGMLMQPSIQLNFC